jgi:hypothetical protein
VAFQQASEFWRRNDLNIESKSGLTRKQEQAHEENSRNTMQPGHLMRMTERSGSSRQPGQDCFPTAFGPQATLIDSA